MAKQQKLTFRFHNPNSDEVTADFLIKLFAEVNRPRVERLILEAIEAEEQKALSAQETDFDR